MFCSKCGKENPDDGDFCVGCGNQFQEGDVAVTSKPLVPEIIDCHEIDYKIIGDGVQFVEIELDPNETVIAEAGAMIYMEDCINFEAKMGDGSKPNEGFMTKMFSAGKRYLTGESLFLTHFTHIGNSGKKHVAFAAPFPGTIIAVDMKEIKGHLICQKDAFLCAAFGTKLDIAFNQKLGAGFFGGEGFILQKIIGNGMAFIHAGGSIVEKELKGETLKIDTGCIVAFESGINYDIQRAGNLKSMFFGGEGLFLATLSGHGKIWIQSMPFSKLADRIINSYGEGEETTPIGGVIGTGAAIVGGIAGLLSSDD